MRPTWQSMNSGTWLSICNEAVFLQMLHQTNTFAKAGLGWRSHFFVRGQIYKQRVTGRIFRALNTHHHAVPMWPLRQLMIDSCHVATKESFWLPDSGASSRPQWCSMLDWTDYEAARCRAISPLGMVARGCPWSLVPHGIIVHQVEDWQDPRCIAAKCGFRGCTKDDLLKLARDSGISCIGC